jgi:Xaa-Pro aminopeptidase
MTKPLSISPASCAKRRKQLMRMAGDDAILVLPAAPERIRSRDTHYPYRQDSDFWYLTGFPEPDAVLVLVPGRAHGEAILFCRERDPEREAWDGPRAGQEGAVEQTSAWTMRIRSPTSTKSCPGLLEGRSRVYYHFGRDAEFDLKLIGWVNRVRAQDAHGRAAAARIPRAGPPARRMRLFKAATKSS